MEITRKNGVLGVFDWADGFRAGSKADGYSPEAEVTWQDALQDPRGALELAEVAGQYRLAEKIMKYLIK